MGPQRRQLIGRDAAAAAASVNAARAAEFPLSSQSWPLFCVQLGSSMHSISMSPLDPLTAPTQPAASSSPSAAVWWQQSPSCSVRLKHLHTDIQKQPQMKDED